jgi:hypothetical protein
VGMATPALHARAHDPQPSKRQPALVSVIPANQQFTAIAVGGNGRWSKFTHWFILYQVLPLNCIGL